MDEMYERERVLVMGYDANIVRRAAQRLEEQKSRRQSELDARREEAYRRLPRVRELDAALRQTVVGAVAAALSQGSDPTQAVEELRGANLGLQAERAALLQGAGIHPACLEETPACPHCNDVGWIKGKGMCACLRALCAQEQTAELSKLLDLGGQSFETFSLDWYPTVPGANGRSPREIMAQVLESCREYARSFGGTPSRNLFLYGGTGLGKTFLSAAIAKEVAEGGHSVVYDTAGTVFAKFETQKFSRDVGEGQEARDETRRYLGCDLLILDDLGSEFSTPFVQAALYTLINTRLVEGKATVISSNLALAEVEKRYSPQVASRLRGEYRPLPFVGEDIRVLRRGGK